MNKYLNSWLIFIFLFISSFVQAQQKILSLENTFDIIRKYHPVAKRADLNVLIAKASLQATRGAFDPAFYIRNEKKIFDSKTYYTYSNQELKIPTWYGIEFKGGFENNAGDRLEPMFTPGKSTYAGFSLPILKNLVLDKRRAALQQGKMMIQLSNQDQLLTINDLLFDAADVYWGWVSAYQTYNILNNTFLINSTRFENVKKMYLGGDRAAIDTTEALSQLQLIQSVQIQSWLNLQKHKLLLSNFLWTESETPFELSDDVIPDSSWNKTSIARYPLPEIISVIQSALEAHPKLLTASSKLDILEIEKKLKFQGLLPTLDLNYNFLNKGYSLDKSFSIPMFQNNYKYGFQLGMSLFQRQARGEYSMAKLKMKDQEYNNIQLRLEIENKVKSYFNETTALQKQIFLFEQNVKNQQLLLKAEETKFSIGESSLFLVNSRENKLLETEQKLAEFKTKFFKNLVAIQWAAGQLK